MQSDIRVELVKELAKYQWFNPMDLSPTPPSHLFDLGVLLNVDIDESQHADAALIRAMLPHPRIIRHFGDETGHGILAAAASAGALTSCKDRHFHIETAGEAQNSGWRSH